VGQAAHTGEARRGEASREEDRVRELAEERVAVYTNTLDCVNLDAGRTVPRAAKVDTVPNFFLIALHREGVWNTPDAIWNLAIRTIPRR